MCTVNEEKVGRISFQSYTRCSRGQSMNECKGPPQQRAVWRAAYRRARWRATVYFSAAVWSVSPWELILPTGAASVSVARSWTPRGTRRTHAGAATTLDGCGRRDGQRRAGRRRLRGTGSAPASGEGATGCVRRNEVSGAGRCRTRRRGAGPGDRERAVPCLPRELETRWIAVKSDSGRGGWPGFAAFCSALEALGGSAGAGRPHSLADERTNQDRRHRRARARTTSPEIARTDAGGSQGSVGRLCDLCAAARQGNVLTVGNGGEDGEWPMAVPRPASPFVPARHPLNCAATLSSGPLLAVVKPKHSDACVRRWRTFLHRKLAELRA